MPELPEVQTTVNGLKRTVVGLSIKDVWSDLPKMKITRSDYRNTIKYLPFFKKFKKGVVDGKILSVERRAKNILINISGGNTILIHMKMTGHIMVGKYAYDKKTNSWAPAPDEKNEALRDPYNRFIHVVFSLSNGKHLAFCDARKFGKVTLVDTKTAHESPHLGNLGPEILEAGFDFKKFKARLLRLPRGKIKTVLMNQSVIAGVGNIYSDEALWLAGIHPLSIVGKIPDQKMKGLFEAVKKVLRLGIDFGGDSTSDYRQVDGKPGNFSHAHNAYQLKGARCKKVGCKGVILRVMVGGRSAHFCSKHQKLLK